MEPGHWIVLTLIICWAVVMLGGMWQANQKEAMKHRERLAMIEKGLPLPPESSGLSPMHALIGTSTATDHAEKERRMVDFIRFLGILTIGGGVGVFFLLLVADQWSGAVGVGGLMVILGTALVVTTMRAVQVRRDS